jgi:hypothetical protein
MTSAMWRACLMLPLILGGAGGCDDEPALPPEVVNATSQPEPQPVIDLAHTISIQADKHFALANIVLVVQRDPMDAGSLGVSRVTSRPGQDGSRLTFGTYARAAEVSELVKQDLSFSTGPILIPNSSSVETPIAVYQPKMATLRITSIKEGEASGSLSGEFYQFKRLQPAKKPAVVTIKASFSAKLIVR